MPELIYLYAIVPCSEGPTAEVKRVLGIDDAPVEGLAAGGLEALLSRVDEASWNRDALDLHVRDMQWLAPRATRHQEVLAAIHTAAPALLPLPFATLYRNPQAIRDLLTSRTQEFAAVLKQLEGAEEWTLKVYQESRRFEQQLEQLSPALAAAACGLRTAAPGKAYLLRKQLDVVRREEGVRVTSRLGDEITDRVTSLVKKAIREPLAGADARETSSGAGIPGGRLVLKLALLLERQRRADVDASLGALVAEYEPFGYHFEVTGPWPPYSFTAIRSKDTG